MNTQSIKNWPEDDRPREKLLKKSPVYLTDTELLAVLLGSGTKGKSVLALARELLAKFHGLRGICALNSEDLLNIKGIGFAKAAPIIAIAEIIKRVKQQELEVNDVFSDPRLVFDYLCLNMRDLKTEVLKIILLKPSNELIKVEDINSQSPHIVYSNLRQIIHFALKHNGSKIILAHNHPTGNPTPSENDIKFTTSLQNFCQGIGIQLADHIIVGNNEYYSFLEKGHL